MVSISSQLTSLISLPTMHNLCWVWRGATEGSASQKSLDPLEPLTWDLGSVFARFLTIFGRFCTQLFSYVQLLLFLGHQRPLNFNFEFLFFFFHSHRSAAALAVSLLGSLLPDLLEVVGEEVGLGAELLTCSQQHPPLLSPLSVPPTSLFPRSFRVEWLPSVLSLVEAKLLGLWLAERNNMSCDWLEASPAGFGGTGNCRSRLWQLGAPAALAHTHTHTHTHTHIHTHIRSHTDIHLQNTSSLTYV